MFSFEPKDYPVKIVHQYLLGGVAPRPIAFVSTIAQDGTLNLAPFSFFNAFGANPPVVAFSPARRGRDASVKDSYNNIMATKECVINAVSYNIIEKVNLASCEYPTEVNEFEKAGFTPIDSDIVKAKRVKESLFQMECKLLQMVHVGESNGSANIAICEVVKFHISNDIALDPSVGGVKDDLLDLVGRNGKELFTRASGSALFTVRKPGHLLGMGFDNLPDFLKNSKTLTGNELAKIAINERFPSLESTYQWLNTQKQILANPDNVELYELSYDFEKIFALATRENSGTEKLALVEKAIKIALSKDKIDYVLHLVTWFLNQA